MFSIQEQTAKMHFNSRSEKNGNDRVPAATLSLIFRVSNDILSEFGPDLKSSFYRRPHPGEGDMADDADTRLDDPHYLSRLKFPDMRNKVVLDRAIIGATVTINHGVGGKSNLVFEECTVDKFQFDPQDGGTVVASLNAACVPSNYQAGELHGKQDQEVIVSITPPEDPQGDLLDS